MRQTDLNRATQAVEEQIRRLPQTLPLFGPNAIVADPAANQELDAYLQFYHLPRPNNQLTLLAGRLEQDDLRSHLMLWKPDQAQSTAVIVHGYLDHTGLYRHLIKHLLNQNIAVLSFDLIGHGLSSGRPASIKCFDQYVAQLDQVLTAARPLCPNPLHGIGQSTGGAVLLKQLFDQGKCPDYPFASLNLLAPLVQPKLWALNKWLFKLTRPFRKTMKRVFRANSQDDEFLDFIRHSDPFQPHRLPADWVGAMADWVEEIGRSEENHFPINVIQGDSDGTLDWQHNIKLLQSKFPNMSLQLVEGAGHHLVNESESLRQTIFAALVFPGQSPRPD